MITFRDFRKKYKLENKPTSNTKISKVINQLNIKDFEIYMGNDKLKTKQGIINLHPKNGTHWVCFYENYYFDSYGKQPSKSVIRQLKPLIYCTYKVQSLENDSMCASYCLYIIYLINIKKKSFMDACSILYYNK